MIYKYHYKTGVSNIANATTLTGAKREATKYANYGYGHVRITEGVDSDSASDPIAVKYEQDNKWVIV